MRHIDKLVLIAILPIIFTTCGLKQGRDESSSAFDSAPRKFYQLVIPDDVDPGLYLYRRDDTRRLVVDFYSEVTGSERVAEAILKYSDLRDIPLPLSFALAWVESRYNTKAVNFNRGSVDRGLFQLNSKSFRFLKEKDFFDPETNARYGTAHLRFCLDRGENEIVALAMYNAGTVGVKTGTPLSTLKYVAKVEEYKDYLDSRFRKEVLGEGSLVLSTPADGDS